MNRHQTIRAALGAGALAAVFASLTAWAVPNNRPTLELFPMPVLDNLKQTAASARSLESSLEGLLKDMELQYQVHESSRCRGAVADPGCQDIERGLRRSYRALLDRMIEELPAMERLVESTRQNLASTLRTQVGLSLSPRDLQRALGQRAAAGVAERRSGGRVGRLSQQFQRYYEMVSRGRGQETTATMAAAIYLDSREALEWIALARQDMQAARTELEISDAFDSFSPQMVATVGQVKGLLFGDVPTLPDAPDLNQAATDPNVRALELD